MFLPEKRRLCYVVCKQRLEFERISLGKGSVKLKRTAGLKLLIRCILAELRLQDQVRQRQANLYAMNLLNDYCLVAIRKLRRQSLFQPKNCVSTVKMQF